MKPLHTKESLYGFASVLLGVLTILAIIVAIGQVKVLDTDKYEGFNSITVSATGESVVIPDVARLRFSVEATAKNVSEAQDSVAKKINDVTKKLGDFDIPKEKVKTENYSSYPKYEYGPAKAMPCTAEYCVSPANNPILVGYTVSHSMLVTVSDLDKAGDVLQMLGNAGVTNISGPDFGLDNPDQGKADARADAIQKARAKAEQIAKSLHVHLGRVVSFSDDTYGYPSPMADGEMVKAYGGASISAAAPIAVSVGESKVTSSVSVTYKIK